MNSDQPVTSPNVPPPLEYTGLLPACGVYSWWLVIWRQFARPATVTSAAQQLCSTLMTRIKSTTATGGNWRVGARHGLGKPQFIRCLSRFYKWFSPLVASTTEFSYTAAARCVRVGWCQQGWCSYSCESLYHLYLSYRDQVSTCEMTSVRLSFD